MYDLKQINELDKKAPKGAFSTLDMEVLIPEVEKLQPGDTYLEIGVDKGKSLFIARMVAKGGVLVYGIDIQQLEQKIPNTTFLWGDSVGIAQRWGDEGQAIDVLFIDGDHSYKGCKNDIDAWYPHMKVDGVMMFHDHDETSPGVMQAVSEFVNNHKLKEYKMFKRSDKNTSMAIVRL